MAGSIVAGGAALAIAAGCLLLVARRKTSQAQQKVQADQEALATTDGSAAGSTQESGARPKSHRSNRIDDLVVNSKMVADALLAVGETVPGIAPVCATAKVILDGVAGLHRKASDVRTAGERVAKTLQVLEILADNADKVRDGDDAKELVSCRMSELHDLMRLMQEQIESFKDRGWLRRKWGFVNYASKLTDLDAAVVECLDDLRFAYQLMNDRRVTSLLVVQKYDLEDAMVAEVRRVMREQSLDEESAALTLAEDDEANAAVANSARVAKEELAAELREHLSLVAEGMSDLRGKVGVVGAKVSECVSDLQYEMARIREGLKKKSQRERAREHKMSVLEKHEICLDSIEPRPFATGSIGRLHRGTYARKTLAVKVIPLSGLSSARRTKLRGEFTNELAIMLSLRSPFVVQVATKPLTTHVVG
ncbi:hypothetical protein CTAYLR_008465 [Chrysophaeum taylorii]|uniref:Protein kinase domain-containing protein n=1 Tax=Chrysophaeum taylorii TaxID=2483200 RepID=A0AAD7UDM7_9STRA|nr:hypothetical protein CTAYLR_008465 [Chrysophaeum taylorii]